MKMRYQGPAPLDPMHVRRQKRRAWFKDLCWELIGTVVFCLGIWAFIILMFCM